MTMISGYMQEQDSLETAYNPTLVPEDSDIDGVEDLEGATIAVNELRAFGETVVRASLDLQGVDSSTVTFVELPCPDMPAALAAGQVDAIWVGEPFVTPTLQAGAVVIDSPMMTIADGGNLIMSGWVTTDEFAAQHPDTVQRFLRAIDKTVDYVASHEAEYRAAIPEHTQVNADLAALMRLPLFDAAIDVDQLTTLSDYAVEYGIIDEPLIVSELVASAE